MSDHHRRSAGRPDPHQRLFGALGTALITAVLGWLLLLGLAPAAMRKVADHPTLVSLLPAPPPAPPERTTPRPRRAREQGAAAPPNLRSVATPIVAPPPVIPPAQPPPIVTAPVAGIGAQASAGAADMPGPGTGSGGQGNGTGSGGSGDGDGGTDLRRLSGDIRTSDVPCFRNGDCPGGTVHLRFVVGTAGSVTSCTVTRSSGSAALDTQTCAAIVRHLRYKPATDATGRPIPAEVTGTQRWGIPDQERDDKDEHD